MSDEKTPPVTQPKNTEPTRPASMRAPVLIAIGTFLAVIIGALGGPLALPWLLLAPIGLVVVFLFYPPLASQEGADGTRVVAFAAAIAASLVVGLPGSAIVAGLAPPNEDRTHWLILVPAGTWLAASIVFGVRSLSDSDDERGEGFWQWILGHKTIAGSIAIVYLSAAGLVHEIQFYDHLRLDALHYVDPATVAYATLSHWQLGLPAALGAFAALGLMMWLWHRLGTRPQQAGRLLDHFRRRKWSAMAVWFLVLPARSVGLARTVIVVVVASVFILVPLAIAAHVADDAYQGIENVPAGTLTLSRPSRSAAGVKHVASTSTHMILVYPCPPAPNETDEADGSTATRLPTWRDHLSAGYRGVSDTLLRTEPSNDFSVRSNAWLPIIVPWSSVASFDLERETGHPNTASQQRGDANTGDGGAQPRDCKPPWDSKPPPNTEPEQVPGSAVGPPGPQGDSVDIQYSIEGTADGPWFDEPTQDVRYIRFRIGEGDWEPTEGIRIAGSRELWYGVSFNRFRLADGIAQQLQVEAVMPQFASQGTGCRVEVTGCASETPFLHACAEEAGTTCTRCTPGRACHPVLARLGDAGGVASYLPAEFLLRYLKDNHALECPDDIHRCVEKVNGILNCGAANLRALAAAAELGSVTLQTAFDQNDLSLEPTNARESPVSTTAGALMRACEKLADGRSLGMATLQPAEASYGSSQCWLPSEARLNHTAIVRLAGDGKGTFGGCLPAYASRFAMH